MNHSYCNACKGPKEDIVKTLCNSCSTRRTEAMQHHAAEHPEASQSDLLYVGRLALNQVSHHAHVNFVDPRNFSRFPGMIPVPPQRGANQ